MIVTPVLPVSYYVAAYSAVDGGVQPGVHTELRMPDAT